MHHARHRQIDAVGAAIVERVRDAMREESAGSGTKQVFFRHPAARQQGMPWHGLDELKQLRSRARNQAPQGMRNSLGRKRSGNTVAKWSVADKDPQPQPIWK